jgi:hypothetical protein
MRVPNLPLHGKKKVAPYSYFVSMQSVVEMRAALTHGEIILRFKLGEEYLRNKTRDSENELLISIEGKQIVVTKEIHELIGSAISLNFDCLKNSFILGASLINAWG